MFDSLVCAAISLPVGFFFGYFFVKYTYDKTELYENINTIKEDLTNLYIQVSNNSVRKL